MKGTFDGSIVCFMCIILLVLTPFGVFLCNEGKRTETERMRLLQIYFSQPFPIPFPKFATVPNLVSIENVIFGAEKYKSACHEICHHYRYRP